MCRKVADMRLAEALHSALRMAVGTVLWHVGEVVDGQAEPAATWLPHSPC